MDADGLAVAGAVGLDVGLEVGVAEVPVDPLPTTWHGPVLAVQVAGITKEPESVNPTGTEAPGARAAFQDRFRAVKVPELTVDVAFHMDTPVPCQGKETDHPLIEVVPVFVITMSTVRPEPQSWVTLIDSATPLALAGGVVGSAVAVGTGVAVEAAGVGAVELAVLAVGDPDTAQLRPATVHDAGASVPPGRGDPMKPNVADAPGARDVAQEGPEKE